MWNSGGNTGGCGEMTVDEIKNRLRAYRRACRCCKELEKQIARRRGDMMGLRAVRTDSLPGGAGNTLEAAVERVDTLERQLQAAQERRERALDDVRALIAAADGGGGDDEDGKKILSLRYIDGVSFEDIPERLYISERSMWRRYNKAISVIAIYAEKLLKNWQ